jgi:hypothetical protein
MNRAIGFRSARFRHDRRHKLNEEEIMILKGTLVAGLVAAVLAFAPASASADTNVRIGVGFGFHPGGVCAGHYSNRCWPRYRRGHWVPYYYPYRTYRYSPAYYGFSCREARWILSEYGFNRVRSERCGGRYHVFIGWRNGHPHLITLRRSNGAIVSVRHI